MAEHAATLIRLIIREKYSVGKAYWIAFLTGLIEPIGALLGYGLVRLFSPALPFILAVAGGAMLFVIADEVIPETHSGGNERLATFALIIGFVIMMVRIRVSMISMIKFLTQISSSPTRHHGLSPCIQPRVTAVWLK
jgi:zinc transporter ZupT